MKAKLKLHTDKKLENTPYLQYNEENRYNKAYTAHYDQACSILQAIRLNGRRRLCPERISQLAEHVTRSWETNTEKETIEGIKVLMNSLLDKTLFRANKSLNEALVEFCEKDSTLESVCPSISLLIAISYVERLKKRYNTLKGNSGCGQRLILVGYMMATKYIHVNLKSIINTTKSESISSSLKENILPPISPTSYSSSNPLNYHYFKTTKETKKSTPISRMELEFLNFLDYNLSLADTIKLTRWTN